MLSPFHKFEMRPDLVLSLEQQAILHNFKRLLNKANSYDRALSELVNEYITVSFIPALTSPDSNQDHVTEIFRITQEFLVTVNKVLKH